MLLRSSSRRCCNAPRSGRVAAARGDDALALRERGQALDGLDKMKGLYDVRVQPRLWLVHSALLLKSGDLTGARQWAGKALEASLRYDDPMSSAIAAARNSVRMADAASFFVAMVAR